MTGSKKFVTYLSQLTLFGLGAGTAAARAGLRVTLAARGGRDHGDSHQGHQKQSKNRLNSQTILSN